MKSQGREQTHHVFDVDAIAASLPAAAETMLVDTRLTDEPDASSRIFRVYRETPPHYHATCDEYLYVLSGRIMRFGEPSSEIRFTRATRGSLSTGADGGMPGLITSRSHAARRSTEWPPSSTSPPARRTASAASRSRGESPASDA